MKQIHFHITTLLLVTTFFLAYGFAQDDVHLKTLTGHSGNVYSVSFSPDGKVLASGSADGTIRLWNTNTGTHLHPLSGRTGPVWSVSFSPDGKTLASGSADVIIRLWNTNTGTLLRKLFGHTHWVESVSFSPNGQTLASGSADEIIRLWNTNTGTLLRTLSGHTHWVESVSFSPNGQTLVSGSADKTIRLWNANTGTHLHTLSGHTLKVYSVSFSPDGKTLASGSADKTIRLWNANTGTHLHTLSGHTGPVESVSFNPDGQTLASGSWDKTVRIWDVETGKHLRTLTGHTHSVESISFSPDGKMLASAGFDKTIRLWRVPLPEQGKLDTDTPLNPTANQIYEKAIRSVMWLVNPDIGEGSGVLIDKKSKLAVTNAHVTGKQNTIDVYFPAPDEKGELIKDRNFYLTNGGVLKRLGYYTKGHVVAKNENTDLAIIMLDGLPETTREIDWNSTPSTTKVGDLVYVLGNPAKQELWGWTLGEFLNDHGDFLHIQSDVFGGNSGGPVLNKQGHLIGIVARSDSLMNAAAIPLKYINQLLTRSKVQHSRLLK